MPNLDHNYYKEAGTLWQPLFASERKKNRHSRIYHIILQYENQQKSKRQSKNYDMRYIDTQNTVKDYWSHKMKIAAGGK